MRTPAKPVQVMNELRVPGEGVVQLGHTVSGSAIELHVQTVSGARASIFLDDDNSRALIEHLTNARTLAIARRRGSR